MNSLKNNEILRTESNTSVILRDYQQTALAHILKKWEDGKRKLLLQMPTGTGKTVVFAEIARMKSVNGGNILIIEHKRELVEQAVSKLTDNSITAGIIMAGEIEDYSKKVQIATIQTLNNRKKPKADLIIIDEAHHVAAKTYRKLWNFYPEAKFLGVTATPIRLNGEGFDDLFDELIVSDSIRKFIDNKYLVSIDHFVCSTPDLSDLKLINGDYEKSNLSRKMMKDNTLNELISTYKSNYLSKSAIVFAVDIEHSKKIVEYYTDAGINAVHIDFTTPIENRKKILGDFRNKKIKVISNVEIITEGFDFPACEVVQLARPTKSLSLYLQMVGRVMRPAAGKSKGIILDHANLWLEHGSSINHRNWNLKGQKNNINKKTDPEVCAFRKDGSLKKVNREDLREINGLKIVPLCEEHKRLFIFEDKLTYSNKRNFKIINAYLLYKEYLKSRNVILTDYEFNYIQNRLNVLNKQVAKDRQFSEGFWYYEERKLQSQSLRKDDTIINRSSNRQMQYSR
jgi:superfamily II DNA or RNA helicase